MGVFLFFAPGGKSLSARITSRRSPPIRRTRAYFRWRNNKNKIKTLVFLGSRKSIAIKRHNGGGGGDEKNNNDYNKSRLPHALQQSGTKIIRNKRKKLVNNKEMFTQQCNPENKFLLLMLSYVLYTYII